MASGWIIDVNLRPFCEIVGAFSGAGLDSWDWDAIHLGVKETDVEKNAWFDYEFVGKHPVKIRVAHDVGTSVLFVDAMANEEIESKVRVAIEIMQSYRLFS
jgi:hypothetical protein